MKMATIMILICTLGITLSAQAQNTHVVGQKDKAFTVKELKVKVGDTVQFLNQDSSFHNVFSLSDAKLFDLGSYPQGEFREVVFDQAGIVEVECAIHPDMRMEIIVEE